MMGINEEYLICMILCRYLLFNQIISNSILNQKNISNIADISYSDIKKKIVYVNWTRFKL